MSDEQQPDLEQPDEQQPEQPDEQQPDEQQPDDEQPDLEQPDLEQPDDGRTFTREYVAGLRREAAGYRTRATEAEAARTALAGDLWTERVRATGRLIDPADLPLADGTDDLSPAAVDAAIDALLSARPHLAKRRVGGSIGQGEGRPIDGVSLLGMLRQGT